MSPLQHYDQQNPPISHLAESLALEDRGRSFCCKATEVIDEYAYKHNKLPKYLVLGRYWYMLFRELGNQWAVYKIPHEPYKAPTYREIEILQHPSPDKFEVVS